VLQSGGGGLVSTAPDYLRFCQMLLNNGELDGERLLGRKTVELMRLNHLPEGVYQDPEVRARGFGLGGYVLLHPERNSANGSVGNIGWGGAANTFFWIDYAEQMVAIIMTQYQPFSPFPLEDMFMNLVYQALV
jgi:CubicO group peptidase (beta-lactamase class C family)